MNTPRLLGKVIDSSVQPSNTQRLLAQSAVIVCVGAAASFLREFLTAVSHERAASRLRREVYSCYLYQPMEDLDEQRTGAVMEILNTDVDVVAKTVTSTVFRGLRMMSSTVGSTVMLFHISPKLTGLTLTVVPLVGVSGMLVHRRVQRLTARYSELLSLAAASAYERLSHIVSVVLANNQEFEIDQYTHRLDQSRWVAVQAAATQGAFMGFLSLAMTGSLLCVVLEGGRMVHRGEISKGDLTSFGVYSGMLGLGAAGLASFFGDFVRAMASARRVFQLIDSRRHIDKATAGGSLPSVQGRVTFQNVSFAYKSRKDQPVLNNLSFEIEPGKITAVTGPSGVGKSTVAALLTKLYTPTAGTILLDGQDIAMLSPKWLRSKIYVVPQQPAIFSGWLIDAVRHGTAANDSQVVNALEQANLGEFVKSLPHGLYTEVGEKGVMLSGGQIQRIAIARAFLRDPAVLVLDEATSNLDTESERAVTEVRNRSMRF
eukprot:c17905_g1_i2.p1 GENE.c17905_g1_i2~~c17905_g1_i2.p1  ORF type:complete len:541 (+),score=122.50 c17905_g1_i2:164-1624(+)